MNTRDKIIQENGMLTKLLLVFKCINMTNLTWWK